MVIARTTTAAAVVVACAAPVVVAAPAHAANSYVALGDSYSSGTGAGSYVNDGTACQRSVHAYPSLLASSQNLSLTFRACSGATVADVTNTQLSALGSATTHVTISVGGNDAGFADVLLLSRSAVEFRRDSSEGENHVAALQSSPLKIRG